MKKMSIRIVCTLLLLSLLPCAALADQLLIPGGQAVGLELGTGVVSIAAFDEKLGQKAKAAGLEIGDQILSIDTIPISSAEDVRRALERSDGSITVEISRKGAKRQLKFSPGISPEGPKLGIYLKQGITGIGTVTYYDPQSGDFGTLGHGVSDAKGQAVTLTEGSAYPARVTSVRKGQSGAPGQLMGTVVARQPFGTLRCNTAQGVFGTSFTPVSCEPLPIGHKEQVHAGSANIYCTVTDGDVQSYSVEILKVYSRENSAGRNLLLKVTDPKLLEITGGIVQGMSGSPIIQDGKLIGAVTHVLVSDPTTGYGIFIENMLDAAA